MKSSIVAWTMFLGVSAMAAGARADRLLLVAGGGTGGDGARADRAELKSPFGLGFYRQGDVIFVEMTGERVRKVDRDGVVTTIAGTGKKGDRGDGGPAKNAEFNGMHSLAVSRNGDIYVADTWNNRVRKFRERGVIRTVAGTGENGFSGDDGEATRAKFGGIYCVALAEGGAAPQYSGMGGGSALPALFLADLDNRRIRIAWDHGMVETIAGNGQKGVPDEGALARSAPLVDPRAVAVDVRVNTLNLYILERGGHALRVLSYSPEKKGLVIRTVAGTGKAGDGGDGGPAIKAQFNGPKHLCVDKKGNVYIADTENHRIRLYNPADGTIRTIVGNGRKGAAGLVGPPEKAELNQPHGVAIGPDGLLYIADSSNHRILKVVPEDAKAP